MVNILEKYIFILKTNFELISKYLLSFLEILLIKLKHNIIVIIVDAVRSLYPENTQVLSLCFLHMNVICVYNIEWNCTFFLS